MSDYLAVIAIAFGTTFSGYAFSMTSAKDDIKMNKNWGAAVGSQSYKTPTTIMLKPDCSPSVFGYAAENEFAELDDDEIKEGYLLFQRFKMELYENKKLDSNIKIKSTSGVESSGLAITTEALAFMKNHALGDISKTLANPLSNDLVRWVVTVPAIWGDTAKKFMRLAAFQAGMVDDILSQNLVIALEPEAASLYCKSLTLDKFMGKDGEKGNVEMLPNEKYMVVDCGGGTIDVTVHETDSDGRVNEVQAASGGPWGATCIDREFFHLLDEIFGTSFMNTVKQESPSTWLAILVDFETKKRAVNPDNTMGMNLTISLHFAKMFEKHTGEDIAVRIKQKKDLGVKFSNGMLKVSYDTVRSMYSEVIGNIKAHLSKILRDVQNVSKMFVVGGFGEAGYIQEMILSEFGMSISIYIPEEAGMCVMKGAVLFGHDTKIVKSRIARYNYGIGGFLTYVPHIHRNRKVHKTEIGDRIETFKSLVKKNERIPVDKVLTTLRRLQNPSQKTVSLNLNGTEIDGIDDPDHPDVTLLETITLSTPTTSKLDRKVTVLLKFGGTDILLKGIDVESGKETSTTVSI